MTALVPLIGPMPDDVAERAAWQVATVRRLGELAARLAEDAALQAIEDAAAAKANRAAEIAYAAEALARERSTHEALQAKEKARAKAHWFQHVPKAADGTAANPMPDYDALFPSLPPPSPTPYRTPKMAGSRAAQVFERMTRLAIYCFAVADRLVTAQTARGRASPDPEVSLSRARRKRPAPPPAEGADERDENDRDENNRDENNRAHPLVAELADREPPWRGKDPPDRVGSAAMDPEDDPHAPDERHATYHPRPPGTPW